MSAGAAPDAHRLQRACEALRHEAPQFSAGAPTWPWQKRLLTGLMAAATVGAIFAPRLSLALLLAVLTFPFLCVVLLRTWTLWEMRAPPADEERSPSGIVSAHEELPHYSVLVPLFQESRIVPQLVRALDAIDYPRHKLEILLIVEACDPETTAAAQRHAITPLMRVVVVPEAQPKTKPKALNYALEEATGAYVVVYDAEDQPEPDQLLRAVTHFKSDSSRNSQPIGCLQARLNIYNSEQSWFTRQFTIEYSVLFDCILPVLQQLRLPVPLGGTSNHFPRPVLEETGGWDPFNVTEDAELGIRLARRGYRVAVLPSTTWEEAPSSYKSWIGQRTRWLKGWLQTYLVHMREPYRIYAELGPRGAIGLQVLMGGMLLSAFVHPWFYVLAAYDALGGTLFAPPEAVIGRSLWWLGLINLICGYLTGAALGAVAIIRRKRTSLAQQVLLMPIYWLFISLAAYRAAWQFVTAPFYWEKTEHNVRALPAGSPQGSRKRNQE